MNRIYTGPVGRLSSLPASSALIAAPRGSASALKVTVAAAEHAERASAIAISAVRFVFTARSAFNPSVQNRIATTIAVKCTREIGIPTGFWSGARDLNPGPHGPEP